MPIYEFYCDKCHMLFDFYSRRINTDAQPLCPRCEKVKLTRQVSSFAVLSGKNDSTPEGMPDIDESKLEKAMGTLAREAENLNEDDPRGSAQLMRKLSEMTGMKLGPGMEEALRRLEAGEDPDEIEAELGDLIEEEEPFVEEGKASSTSGARKRPPKKDDTLYEL